MKNNLKKPQSQLSPKVLFKFKKNDFYAKLMVPTDPTTATTATVTTVFIPGN